VIKSLRFWLGLGISLVMILWALSQVDLGGLGRALVRTNYSYLLLCLPIIWLQYVVRALRWDYLLRPVAKVPYRSLLASTVVGFTGNLLLPARLGEIMSAVDVGRREGISKASALATILLERVLDGLAVVPLFLLAAWSLGVFAGPSDMAGHTRTAATVFGLVYLGVLIVVVALSLNPRRSLALLGLILSPLPQKISAKLLGFASSIVAGLMLLRYPRLLVPALAYTLILWLMLAAPLYILALAVGHPVSFTAALFVNGLICLAIAVPSAPGYVGTFHYAIQVGFGVLLGMSQEKALALAVIFHGVTFAFTVLYCLTFLVRGRVSLLDLGRTAEREQSGR